MIRECINRNPSLVKCLTGKTDLDHNLLHYAIARYVESVITGLLCYMIEIYSAARLESAFRCEPALSKYMATTDDRGFTPMHAVMVTDVDFKDKMELLIKNGCANTFGMINHEGLTPVQLGMRNVTKQHNRKTLVDIVSCHSEHVEPNYFQIIFHEACDIGSNNNVNVWLLKGADPFLLDDNGVAGITKAALSNFEPRQKLRSLQNADISKVSIQAGQFIILQV